MSEKLLTMVMVAYNEEKYIGQAIESLLAQTYKDFILIISDNASTDRTSQICEEYAKKDKRIIYTRHEKNMGCLANWRYVIEKTNTPYFMLCSGHDKWHPGFAEKLLRAFKDKKVVLSYSESGSIEMDGATGKIVKDDYSTMNIDKPVDRYLYFLRNYRLPNIFHGIFRTEALKNCDLNLKSPTADIIILEQTAFEGKFKQYKEVLFWMRTVRGKESYNEMARRQLSAAHGKPAKDISIFSIKTLHMAYVAESIKIIFRKRYSLGMFTKIWLVINVICLKVLYRYTMLALGAILKKFLPDKTFSKLKDIWHKNQYQEKNKNKNKEPLVSIITPTFNGGQFLEKNILSIKNQNYPFIEHIIIDAASRDNTIEIIKKYEGAYNLKWISEKDSGCTEGMNKGFRMATGDILCWLDSDDIYLPGTIEKVARIFEAQPEVDFVFGDNFIIDKNDKIIDLTKRTDFNLEAMLYIGMSISPQAAFWRRRIHEKVGALDQKYFRCADREFFIRMAFAGAKFYHIRDFLALYRLHSSQLTLSKDIIYSENNKILLKYDTHHFNSKQLEWKRRKILFKKALKHIKQGDIWYLLKRILEDAGILDKQEEQYRTDKF